MIIQHGVKPKKSILGLRVKDHKALSFHRTFGAIYSISSVPDFNLDAGLTNFAQNDPNPVFGTPAMPEGCTAMCQTDIGTDLLKTVFSPYFTLINTCMIEDIPTGGPCTMEASSQAVSVYGLQALNETAQQALSHKLINKYVVEPINGDWFLGMVSAMQNPNGSSISLAGTWSEAYEFPVNGVVPHPTADDDSSGHDWKICGLKRVNGVPYLIAKPWLGPNWGGAPEIQLPSGFCLFSQSEINYIMNLPDAEALCFSVATPADAQRVKLSIEQVLLSYLQRLLAVFAPTPGSLVLSKQLLAEFQSELNLIEEEFESMTGIKTPTVQSKPVATSPTLTVKTTQPMTTTQPNVDALPVSFANPQQAFHAVRVLADLAGMTPELKDDLTACIYVESGFENYKPDGTPMEHPNYRTDGSVASTDWGICQVNDYYHIKPNGGPFESVDYVLANPQAVVEWMIQQFLNGGAKQWVSYSSGAYKAFLPKTSVMWNLDTVR